MTVDGLIVTGTRAFPRCDPWGQEGYELGKVDKGEAGALENALRSMGGLRGWEERLGDDQPSIPGRRSSHPHG